MKRNIKEIIDRIVVYRKAKGMTQKEMADELDIAQVNYSKVESGKTELTLSRLMKIADILDLKLSTLIDPVFSDDLVFSDERINKEMNAQKLTTENERLSKAIAEKQKIIDLQDQVNQNLKNAVIEAYKYAMLEKLHEISQFMDEGNLKNQVSDLFTSYSNIFFNKLKDWGCYNIDEVEKCFNEIKSATLK